MQVFVNERRVDVLSAMTVRHALLAAGVLDQLASGRHVFDEWGNELGLDGAVSEGSRLYVR